MRKRIPSEKDKIIWDNIWALAQEKGYNLTTLAAKVNTQVQSVNNIKKDKSGIGPGLLRRFAKALNTSERFLMTPRDEPRDMGLEYTLSAMKTFGPEERRAIYSLIKILQYDRRRERGIVIGVIDLVYSGFEEALKEKVIQIEKNDKSKKTKAKNLKQTKKGESHENIIRIMYLSRVCCSPVGATQKFPPLLRQQV